MPRRGLSSASGWRIRRCSALNGLPMPVCPTCSASTCTSHRLTAVSPSFMPANLANSQILYSDHLHDLQLEAQVKNPSFRFCHYDCPGGSQLSACLKLVDLGRQRLQRDAVRVVEGGAAARPQLRDAAPSQGRVIASLLEYNQIRLRSTLANISPTRLAQDSLAAQAMSQFVTRLWATDSKGKVNTLPCWPKCARCASERLRHLPPIQGAWGPTFPTLGSASAGGAMSPSVRYTRTPNADPEHK